MGGSIVTNIGVDYAISRITGQTYGTKDAVTAAALGAIPGIGLVKPGGRVLSSGRHLVNYDKKYDTFTGATMTMIHYNRRDISRILQGVGRTQLIKRGIDSRFQSRDGSKSYQQTKRLGTTTTRIPGAKRSTVQKKTSRRTAFSGDARRRTTYCKRHKQYDFCEKYNIRK